MALRVKAENVPVKKVVLSADQGQGSMVVKQAYGNESSLMMATRPPGYHTKPHMHVSEQINHVLEGEIWFFVEDQGYLCKQRDRSRRCRIVRCGAARECRSAGRSTRPTSSSASRGRRS